MRSGCPVGYNPECVATAIDDAMGSAGTHPCDPISFPAAIRFSIRLDQRLDLGKVAQVDRRDAGIGRRAAIPAIMLLIREDQPLDRFVFLIRECEALIPIWKLHVLPLSGVR